MDVKDAAEESFIYYNVTHTPLGYYNMFYYTPLGKGTHAPSSISGSGW